MRGHVGVEQHHVPLPDLDALLLGGTDDVLLGVGRARFDDLLAEIAGHVEYHASGDDGRILLDAELGEARGLGEVADFVAVVVDVVDADVAEPINL